MRPLMVELVAEAIHPRLLASLIRRRGRHRLGLEGSVHALVTPVLLRISWLDALQLNPQSQPSDLTDETTRRDARDANGGPLSVRSARGRPKSLNVASKAGQTPSVVGRSTATQHSR